MGGNWEEWKDGKLQSEVLYERRKKERKREKWREQERGEGRKPYHLNIKSNSITWSPMFFLTVVFNLRCGFPK